ncbi:MAG: undecaprenyl-diphosphate phosphatase [Candidatus Aminicenantes bacterium]|nr:undecaprenyl-diphosphate phosphatase [Candidatus Aminicenantes bacterium]
MDFLYSLLAGIVQGLTEFLPISSSGHLVIIHDIFKFEFFDNVLYDVGLHVATALALAIFFRREILVIIRGFARSLRRWDFRNDPEQRLAWLVILATLPAVVVGLFFGSVIEKSLRSPLIVATALAVVGISFFVAEKLSVQKKLVAEMTPADAVVIGAAQVLAFIPGVSRSGIALVAGLGRKLRRAEAARFSFLLSIPTIIGAAVKTGLKGGDWSGANWPVLAVGFAAAFVSGILTIRYFLKFVARHPLHVFAWYRIGISLLILLWLALSR